MTEFSKKIVSTQSWSQDTKTLLHFINIFSEIEIDLWSGGIFFHIKHTPKEAAKHQ